MTTNYLDVVTPLGPKDCTACLHPTMTDIEVHQSYVRKNIVGIRDHYIITDQKITNSFKEDNFPFSLHDVKMMTGLDERAGWYLQQLIKLYSWKVIPGLSDPYLVIDADTFFLKPTTFIENNILQFHYTENLHEPYFEHMQRLFPKLCCIQETSGIAHHMPMSHGVLADLFDRVEKIHGVPFWQAFLDCIDSEHIKNSGASEYEIVFHYMRLNHPEKINTRKLKIMNRSRKMKLNNISQDWDILSLHHFL